MADQHINPIYNNFNGGEISSRMQGRTDTAIYPISLAEMIGFAPSVEGPAVKCPGFRYIRAAAASAAWLSPFVFSRTQAYVLEWGEQLLRFYTNGGRIEAGAEEPYELAIPYAAAEAPFVSAQQSYDRLYLAHRAHALASLTRLTATTFSFAALELENGPFGDVNKDETLSVAFTASSGAATAYASGAMFLEEHEGSLFFVETRDTAETPQWQAGLEVSDGQLRASAGGVYLKIGGADRTGDKAPSHREGAAWDGDGAGTDVNGDGPYGAQWLFVHGRFGIVRLDTYVGPTQFECTVIKRLPDSAAAANAYADPGGVIDYEPPYSGDDDTGFFPNWSVDPETGEFTPIAPGSGGFTPPTGAAGSQYPGSWRWAHAAISDAAGWPVAVLLAWGRLVLFTDFEIIGSVVGDYAGGRANFAEYADNDAATVDMAFRRRLSISNPVIWAREDRGNILVGTQDGEYLIGPINPSAIVSAENIQCVKQTRHGSAAVFPIDAAGETIFVQKGGRVLRQATYSFERDRYAAFDLTVFARHVLETGCVQLAYEQDSEEMLWALRADGVLAAHPHAPEPSKDIKGFARRIHAAGPVLSTCCVPSEDGTLDEQWILVENEATGAKSVEQRAPWWVEGGPKGTAFFVDSGVTVESPASLTLTGLGWLAGRAVGVLSDGAVIRGLSVTAGGALTLPPMAQLPGTVTVGLNYRASFRTLKPELRDPRGNTMQGKMQKLFRLALRLLETLGVRVSAQAGVEDEWLQRGIDVPMGEGPAFFSGDKEREVDGQWDREGQFELISEDPVPCIVVAAMPRLAVSE